MSPDFVIPSGTNMRLTPVRDADPALLSLLDSALGRHDCLKAYSLFFMRRGWLFPRKSPFACLIHDDANAFAGAYADIGRSLATYFETHAGVLDVMSLDIGKEKERSFAGELMSKLPFRKKEPNQSPEPTVMSVTPRADARVAPATTVAHL